MSSLSKKRVIPIKESCHSIAGKVSFGTKERFPGYKGKVSFVRNDKPARNAPSSKINVSSTQINVSSVRIYTPLMSKSMQISPVRCHLRSKNGVFDVMKSSMRQSGKVSSPPSDLNAINLITKPLSIQQHTHQAPRMRDDSDDSVTIILNIVTLHIAHILHVTPKSDDSDDISSPISQKKMRGQENNKYTSRRNTQATTDAEKGNTCPGSA